MHSRNVVASQAQEESQSRRNMVAENLTEELVEVREQHNYDGEYVLGTVEDVMESAGTMCVLTHTDIDELVWRNLENVNKA